MLSDLTILDLSAYLPGPFATQLLADLGARVLKVEPPGGEPARHVPPHDSEGMGAAFRALNAGKESLALDLKAPAGRDLLLRLCERADVLIEGFRPGVMERLGLGPEACLERNPRLVFCRLTGFGQDGPYARRAGHDLSYQAHSGALGLGAAAEGGPATPGVQSGDLLAGYAAALGILAAVRGRSETGGGRVVDVGILDALLNGQGLHFMAHASGLAARARALPLNGALPCYDVYATSCGGHFALSALEPKFWSRFCEIVARPEWLERSFDPSLRPELAELFASRTRDEWRVVLENADCCASAVLTYDEVLADDHVQARGSFLSSGRPAPPFRFDPPQRPAERPVPSQPGCDRDALLEELLGCDEAERSALAADGAFGAQ